VLRQRRGKIETLPMELLFWLPALLIPPGIVLLTLGLRGRRVGDHPYCRKCGFDLFGRPPESTRCSECGSDLSGRKAIIIGTRASRHGALYFGAALLAVGGLFFDWRGAVSRVRGIEWYEYEPAWLLLRQAMGSTGRRSEALGVLAIRLREHRLSDSQLRAMGERILAAQADPKVEWDVGWGGLFEAAEDQLPPELWKRYAQQAAGASLRVRPLVRLGDPIPAVIEYPQRRLAMLSKLSCISEVEHMTLFGKQFTPTKQQMGARSPELPIYLRFLSDSFQAQATVPGHHVMTAHVVTHIYQTVDTGTSGAKLVAERTEDLSASFQLLSSKEQSVQLVDDESMTPSMRRAIVFAGGAIYQAGTLELPVQVSSPPTAVAFDVVVRAKGVEWTLKPAVMCAPKYGVFSWPELQMPDPGDGPISVALRPDRRAATETVDLLQIWGREIDVPRVTVQH
jgi:hypothetical protein